MKKVDLVEDLIYSVRKDSLTDFLEVTKDFKDLKVLIEVAECLKEDNGDLEGILKLLAWIGESSAIERFTEDDEEPEFRFCDFCSLDCEVLTYSFYIEGMEYRKDVNIAYLPVLLSLGEETELADDLELARKLLANIKE